MKYRPDQARDRIGRWTRDRGAAAPANLAPADGDLEAGSEDSSAEDGGSEAIPDLGETADGREFALLVDTGRSSGTDPAETPGEDRNDTDDPGEAEVQLAASPPRTPVYVRGRIYLASEREATQLLFAANRADVALARVRALDPEWRAAPSLSDAQSAQGAIRAYTSLAQQAESRALVLERDGVPLGFETREQFVAFGRRAWDGLAEAGLRDAEPYLRGSAITGYNYRTGEAFDVGRKSDFDIAIVSPSLVARAEQLGVKLSGQGTRTAVIEGPDLEALNLAGLRSSLEVSAGRPIAIMLYRSRADVLARVPVLPLP